MGLETAIPLSAPGFQGGVRMTQVERVEQFADLRALLFSIAYRTLASVTEAEDDVPTRGRGRAAVRGRPPAAGEVRRPVPGGSGSPFYRC